LAIWEQKSDLVTTARMSTESNLVTTAQHLNWQPLGHDGTTSQLRATWSRRYSISTDSHLVTTVQHLNWEPLGHDGTTFQLRATS
jgi:hypothetical protein